MSELESLAEELMREGFSFVSLGKNSVSFPFLTTRAKLVLTQENLPYKIYLLQKGEWSLKAEEFFIDELWNFLESWCDKFG